MASDSSLDAQIQARVANLAKEPAHPLADVTGRPELTSDMATTGINVAWSEVVGFEEAKRKLDEAIAMSTAGKPVRLMLHGPPGIGKTTLAKACKDRVEGAFLDINCTCLGSARTSGLKILQSVFAQAIRDAPSLILFDDFDVFSKASGGINSTAGIDTGRIGLAPHMRHLLVELLAYMDYLDAVPVGVCVVVVVQQSLNFGKPVLRRFQVQIPLSAPDGEERHACLLAALGLHNLSLTAENWNFLLEHTEGFGIGEMRCLARDAAMHSVRETLSARTFKPAMDDAIVILVEATSYEAEDAVTVCCTNALTGNVITNLTLEPNGHVSTLRAFLRQQLGSDLALKLLNCNYSLLEDDVRVIDVDTVLVGSQQQGGEVQWTPCDPNDPEAVPMKYTDISESQLCLPPVTFAHIQRVLKRA